MSAFLVRLPCGAPSCLTSLHDLSYLPTAPAPVTLLLSWACIFFPASPRPLRFPHLPIPVYCKDDTYSRLAVTVFTTVKASPSDRVERLSASFSIDALTGGKITRGQLYIAIARTCKLLNPCPPFLRLCNFTSCEAS